MKSYILITASGPDRPGIVDEVTEYLVEREMNIESSRMAVLGGEFAMIILVSGDPEEMEKVAADPSGLTETTGLQVAVKKTAAPEDRVAPPSLPFRIVAAGMDHPGIVHDISKVLHSLNVNIESMDTRVVPAPVSGTPMFSLEALVSVPAQVKIRNLHESLESLSYELNIEIEVEPVEVS